MKQKEKWRDKKVKQRYNGDGNRERWMDKETMREREREREKREI